MQRCRLRSARVGVLALLWGSTFLWIELALDALAPVQVTLARCVLGAATLLVLCFGAGLRLPRGRGLWARIVVAAFFCNALPFTMFSIGQQTVDSGVAGVLNATTPALVAADRPRSSAPNAGSARSGWPACCSASPAPC